MRKTLKSVFIIMLSLVIAVVVFSFSASAVTGRTSISCSENNPTVGDTITVTVNYSASNEVNGAQGVLKFSADNLQYVSGSNTNLTGSGSVSLVASGASSTAFSFSIRFKVIKEGSAELILGECQVADGSGEYSLTGSSVRLVVLSGNEGYTSSSSSSSSKSSNANLKSITVAAGTLTPAFSANVTEYTVTVPYEKTDGIISYAKADSAAKCVINGERELGVGLTKRTITVTAGDGTKKVYTVTFNRLDENGKDTTATEPNTDIEVTYNGVKHFLTSDFAAVTIPKGFAVGIYKYGEQEVSCLKDASGKMTVLCLIPEDSEEKKFFIYDSEKGFSDFNYIEINDGTYIILELDQGVMYSGYKKSDYEYKSLILPCYIPENRELKDFIVFKAVAPDGTVGFYRYDTAQNSLQRYPDFAVNTVVDESAEDSLPASRKILIIVLLILAVELLIAVIVISVILVIKSVNKKKENPILEDYDVEQESDEPIFESGVESDWIKSGEEEEEE